MENLNNSDLTGEEKRDNMWEFIKRSDVAPEPWNPISSTIQTFYDKITVSTLALTPKPLLDRRRIIHLFGKIAKIRWTVTSDKYTGLFNASDVPGIIRLSYGVPISNIIVGAGIRLFDDTVPGIDGYPTIHDLFALLLPKTSLNDFDSDFTTNLFVVPSRLQTKVGQQALNTAFEALTDHNPLLIDLRKFGDVVPHFISMKVEPDISKLAQLDTLAAGTKLLTIKDEHGDEIGFVMLESEFVESTNAERYYHLVHSLFTLPRPITFDPNPINLTMLYVGDAIRGGLEWLVSQCKTL